MNQISARKFRLCCSPLAALLFAAWATSACGSSPSIDDERVGSGDDALVLGGITLQTVLVPRYVGAQNNGGGAVIATATVANTWETFSIEDINGGSLVSGDSVFIRAGNGQYFQAVNGGGSTLNAASNNKLGWETFKVVRQAGAGTVANGDVVGFQTSSGAWISAQNGGGGTVYAYGGAFGSWEQFKIAGLGSSTPPPTPTPTEVATVSFRTTLQNRYVGAQNNGGGAVNATATVAQGWETFTLVDLNGGALASGDSVRVRTGGGQYFSAANGGGSTLSAAGSSSDANGIFKLVRKAGAGNVVTGDVVGLQAPSGSWVSAENGGGGAVYAYGGALGSWEELAIGVGTPSVPPSTGSTRVVGYLPNWYGSYASWASKLDFSKVTQLNLAFALGDSSGNLQLSSDADLKVLVDAAHARGVKVYPSLCGGGGDDQIVPFYQPNQVDGFVDKIMNFTTRNHFDGIDVDVEAPDRMGATYDTFIAKLKARASAAGLQVTAAVAQWMQYGMSDTTLRSFDAVNVMSYDNTGTWTGPGEHSTYQQAVDALNYYAAKGVARSKIVLGVPFYGYCWGNCGGSSSSYILYKDILAKFPSAASSDWIDQNGAQYSYNGIGTMARKTDLAQQWGGIMIWELGGDVSSSSSNSLLLSIHNALQ